MIEYNKVILVGNLTRDPEVRYLPSGTAIASFDIAVNNSYKDKNGEKKKDVMYINISIFGKIAELCGEYLKKGRAVLVDGRLKQDSWESKDGTGKRTKISVVAETIKFFPDRNASVTEAPYAGNNEHQGNKSSDNNYDPTEGFSPDERTEDDLPF